MIKKQYWFDIHTRGLKTVGGGAYATAFTVGECSLTSHLADVHSLYDYITQRETAKMAVDSIRNARNTTAPERRDICTRACKAISGSLPNGHPLHTKVSEVRGLKGRSQDGVQQKARKLVALWAEVNAYRASLNPVLPPLEVDGYTASGFQSSLGNHAQ